MDKKHQTTLSIQVRSTVNMNQIVNNTATKHSLCPGNGVFAHEKCIIFDILYIFASKTTKTRHLKNTKKHLKNLKKHKNMFF